MSRPIIAATSVSGVSSFARRGANEAPVPHRGDRVADVRAPPRDSARRGRSPCRRRPAPEPSRGGARSRRGSGPRSARPSGAARASLAIARRISTFCCSAVRRVRTTACGSSPKPVRSFSSSKRLRTSPVADDARGVRLDPEHHVLDHGARGHERDLLGDRRDARVEGVPRRMERDGPAVDEQLALVGPVHAADHLGERRLARRRSRRRGRGRAPPASTIETSSSAWTPPNRFEIPRASTRGRASPRAPSSSTRDGPVVIRARRLDSVAVLRLEVRLRQHRPSSAAGS